MPRTVNSEVLALSTADLEDNSEMDGYPQELKRVGSGQWTSNTHTDRDHQIHSVLTLKPLKANTLLTSHTINTLLWFGNLEVIADKFRKKPSRMKQEVLSDNDHCSMSRRGSLCR